LSRSWAGTFHEWLELMQKDDNVLAKVAKADHDSGGYSRVIQDPFDTGV